MIQSDGYDENSDVKPAEIAPIVGYETNLFVIGHGTKYGIRTPL